MTKTFQKLKRDERRLSLCVTTYKRFQLTVDSVSCVIDDPRIGDVVIVDDCSPDGSYEKLVEHFKDSPKVAIYRNAVNLDCYLNKKEAIGFAKSEYVIIFDSDNKFSADNYLSPIFAEEWTIDTILAPSFAKPNFDYRVFSGLTITKENVASHMGQPMFSTMLNTSNYFVNRDEYLKCFDDKTNPITAEAIYTNYNWLKAGNKIKVLADMEYEHLVHGGSHWQNNNHKTGNFLNIVEQKLRELK